MNNPEIVYSTKTKQYDVPFKQYTAYGKEFGEFEEDGKKYAVTDKNTPRQWLNFLVNEDFGCVAANDGAGYTFRKTANSAITKYYSATDYLVRTLNGRRRIAIENRENGESFDLLLEGENFRYTAEFGRVVYTGNVKDVFFEITIFVPEEDPLEIWKVVLRSRNSRKYRIAFSQDVCGEENGQAQNVKFCIGESGVFSEVKTNVFSVGHDYVSFFASPECAAEAVPYEEAYSDGVRCSYLKETLSKEFCFDRGEKTFYVLSGAVDSAEGAFSHALEQAKKIIGKYENEQTILGAMLVSTRKKQAVTERNYCVLPDKNMQNFLNVWLKNQLYLTMRFNRCDIMGYRDVMQDAWGNVLCEPEAARKYILQALGKMHVDGRCPRQYDRTSAKLDDRDFMDSLVWAAIAVADYIKETGERGFLYEKTGWLETPEEDTVKEHLLRAFEYLHEKRGKNGLLLMREGDWLDGLSGIDAYGEATTVWGTIAVYHAQNYLIGLFESEGDFYNVAKLEKYNDEYKKVVNEKGWNGKWYTYAFIDDAPIGAKECNEGKIYLNAQTWAIMSGIYDTPEKAESMYGAIHTYLTSMYGPHLLFPPYISEGDKFGRLQKHKPGTFSNGAIYLHGAAFKAFADARAGKYREALDTFLRILPNHADLCASRRTSEPYAVGNVYYGITHECFGMNLYTWFTATPAWLIHTGFEELLGVKADYDGLKIDCKDIFDGKPYEIRKKFHGNEYVIRVVRGERKGVYAEGVKLEGTLVKYEPSNKVVEIEAVV